MRSLRHGPSLLAVVILLGAISSASAGRLNSVRRGRSTVGQRTLEASLRHVNKLQPRPTHSLHRELGFPREWGEQFPAGLCAAFVSSAIADSGTLDFRRQLYTNYLAASLSRFGFRATTLDRAPIGSIVAVTTPERGPGRPYHFSILEDHDGDVMSVVESGYRAGGGQTHFVQRNVFDGVRWGQHQVGYVLLAPPDTRF